MGIYFWAKKQKHKIRPKFEGKVVQTRCGFFVGNLISQKNNHWDFQSHGILAKKSGKNPKKFRQSKNCKNPEKQNKNVKKSKNLKKTSVQKLVV